MRLVMCDNHRLFAEPLAVALERRGHRVVVTASPEEALRAVAEDEPDLCLMDLRFPGGDGIAAIAELTRRHPLCRVVVLSGVADPRSVAGALAAGAAAFVRKDQPLSAVFAALDSVAVGEQPLPPCPQDERTAERHGWSHSLIDGLTRRERQVLGRLVKAEDTVSIARSLGVAPSTARTHLQSVLTKLGVNNRIQAVALVARAGLDGDW